ncbi:MAG: ATP-binding protein [Archangium sp.]|nr:ATP-binding protein [Archangium sp.]MDP3572173.1 ATP-binding protein [Archangium sp.]
MSKLETLAAAIVLPPEITDFERIYLARMNRVALFFFAAHVPVFAVVAFLNGTGPLLAAGLTLLGVAGPFLAQRALTNPRHVSMVFGVTAMFMGALLVHFGRGMWTIEMHFYFFVALALLVVFANPLVIITAAVTVAVHHLVLWYVAPQTIFNYDAPVSSVLLHALFVVLESVAACFVSRSFFDNVIGLERIVRARTADLHGKNREMRLVFDHVQQGFLTVDAQGRLAAQHSRVVAQWFAVPVAGQTLSQFFAPFDARFAQWLDLGWDTLKDDIFPRELALAQMPASLSREGRSYELSYQPIDDAKGALEQVLVLITDVTERRAREAADLAQRETLQVFERLMRDRVGFLEFFAEGREQVAQLGQPNTDETIKRLVHTLKGNTALFGMSSVADACHAVESRVADRGDAFTEEDRHEVVSAWQTASGRVLRFFEQEVSPTIELDEADYLAIVHAIDHGAPRLDVLQMIESWRHEPVSRRFERLAEQASGIAGKEGKGPVKITIDAPSVRLPREQFARLWSTAVHLVRNAVDHGLLPSSDRPPQLLFSARIRGQEVELRFADNGRGIDWDGVAAAARQRQLPSEGNAALVEALFHDGLSTRGEATALSGRGVGLSAVKHAVSSLGGRVEVESQPGAGTTFILRVPLPRQQTSRPDEPAARPAGLDRGPERSAA